VSICIFIFHFIHTTFEIGKNLPRNKQLMLTMAALICTVKTVIL